ncbi:MAG TPA: caspase family protein, partial [Campylobacterales bacterium]|nr:caspase family protein [Campylobacterales bacterium]
MRVLLVITLLFGILNAQNREALLIGNSNYQYISNLNDTSSNLSRLQTTLESLGFTVKVKNNLEAKRLKQAIDNFKERLAQNRDTIGFLYYSGHGCQVDNVGYLIPTNVNSSKKLDVKYDALNIDKMLESLKEAGNRVNMLFLDACRDNTPTGTKGGKKGLAQAPLTPKGTLVVYATEATKTADDNNNFVNSLITQIQQPNQSIRD